MASLFTRMRIAAARGLLHGVGKKYSGPMAAYGYVPPTMSAAEYVKAYGEIGWLYACVSKRAGAVASMPLRIFKLDREFNQVEIFDHPVIKLLNKPNPYLTGHKLRLLTQIYMDLCGESFWVMERGRDNKPSELWIVNPAYMTAVPDKENHIKGWVYKAGSESIPIEPEDVIHLYFPNPDNPYRGIGPAQAAAVDLDSSRFAKDWNKRFFYNSARPDAIIEFKEALSEEDYNLIVQHWNESHAGVSNAHKIGMLELGSYKQISVSPKDMDFSALQTLTRDNILSIFGVPKSILGITDDVNRANAETAEYTFAKWTVKPLLDFQQDDINNSLIPMFGEDNIVAQFDDPTPENVEQKLMAWEKGWNKWLTTNEIREEQGREPVEGGDELYIGFALVPMGQGSAVAPGGESRTMALTPKSKLMARRRQHIKAWLKSVTREAYWRDFVVKATANEKQLRPVWSKVFKRQMEAVLAAIPDGKALKDIDEDDVLNAITSAEEQRRINGSLRPLIEGIFGDSAQAFFDETGMGIEFNLRNPQVEKWIDRFCAKQIGGINDTTRGDLRNIIRKGESDGRSIEQIKDDIRGYFTDSTERRLDTIVRTEVISASNAGTLEGYKQSGVVEQKEWLTAIDERTRESHIMMDGTKVGVEEDFEVGNGAGPAPGNIGLAEEDCNCRCTILPVIQD